MIKMFDAIKTLEPIETEIMAAITKVLHSGHLMLGPETEAFEHEFASTVGAKYCVAVNSGTTALQLALMGAAIGQNDEVITVANTCVPTISAIELAGATPVFSEISETDLLIDPTRIEQAISPRTKAILPVHLWGQCAAIDQILDIARRHGLLVIEDCAQAQDAYFRGQHAGTFGQAGCFSFYPTKNLGAYGDAGAIVTNDAELAGRLRRMRMYGYHPVNYAIERGMNARISEIQATILRVKLRYLPQWMEKRRRHTAFYDANLRHTEIRLPHRYADRVHAFHQYVVRCCNRTRVIQALEAHNIQYGIHYPTPIHLMPAYQRLQPKQGLPITERASAEILSLPIHEALTDDELSQIAQVLCQMPI